MRQRFTLRVASQQPRNPHGAVVHVHPLLVPGHGIGQDIEELVGRGDEARAQVDPGTVRQRPTFDRLSEIGDPELADGAKERRLDDERHPVKFSPAANTRSL